MRSARKKLSNSWTGRPTLLDPQIERKILANIRRGGTPRASAIAAGVNGLTYDDWIQRGLGLHPDRPAIEPFASFARKVLEAAAKKRIECERAVAKAQPLAFLRATARDVWTETMQVDEQRTIKVIIEYENDPLAPPAAARIAGDGDDGGAPV